MRISEQQIAIYRAGRGRCEGLPPGRCPVEMRELESVMILRGANLPLSKRLKDSEVIGAMGIMLWQPRLGQGGFLLSETRRDARLDASHVTPASLTVPSAPAPPSTQPASSKQVKMAAPGGHSEKLHRKPGRHCPLSWSEDVFCAHFICLITKRNPKKYRDDRKLLGKQNGNEIHQRNLSKNPLTTLSWQLFQHLQVSEL
ncbi:hypothetical protein EYF80_019632 [Liparis tanakae]|uniref:Uncharacterized protein n=1 Tax=Liparis tanakae TaxID=230148 RepID=A0A4Z2HYV8_9TELE|nr:hypothetical protein EYF80_019632 [Liparis tanakae]